MGIDASVRPRVRLAGRRLVLGLATIAGLACGGGDTGGPRETGTIAPLSGDAQTATVGTTLQPYRVLVTDPQGQPRADAKVSWSLKSGGGVLAAGSSQTDASGIAEITSTLGTLAGAQAVQASIQGYSGSPVGFASTGTAGPPAGLTKLNGDNQTTSRAQAVLIPPTVLVTDAYGNGVGGVTIGWAVQAGGGSVGAPTSVSGPSGAAAIAWTLGATPGTNLLAATLPGDTTVTFAALGVAAFSVDGGGNNVSDRYTSDLWVADGYAYTGTWGFRGAFGNAVKIWQLDPGGAPVLTDSIITPGISTVSDLEVSPDGQWLVFTSEGGANRGIHAYELTSPGVAVSRAALGNTNGLHTGTLAVIGGTLYAFAAQDPPGCALKIYDLSAAASGTISVASSTTIPDNYCIHDTFVRDGYAFVFAWDEGLYIYDVGNGSHGGSPANPVEISKTGSPSNLKFGGETHNGWWFHNPVSGEQKYLFIGEEGPGAVGSSSSGDIHVVDVSDFAHPVEVASFRLAGAGTHNFWVDEPDQRLYAAYYNGGVVALDISGVLAGNLSNRIVAQVRPGGSGNTYVWGVMLYGGSLYASDMISGLWQLGLP
ncbi:MAG: Ig-like domain-containing protein [Gemmatimonadetes bacterium]|nr:Ig-like domain-containing protein [Gemmatimonadota bacterium]